MSLGETGYLTTALAANDEIDNKIRTLGALLAGIAAGVIGVTGLTGFLFFVVCAAVTSLAISLLGCEADIKHCISPAAGSLFSLGSLMRGAMTYILAWTVVYDAIYIF